MHCPTLRRHIAIIEIHLTGKTGILHDQLAFTHDNRRAVFRQCHFGSCRIMPTLAITDGIGKTCFAVVIVFRRENDLAIDQRHTAMLGITNGRYRQRISIWIDVIGKQTRRLDHHGMILHAVDTTIPHVVTCLDLIKLADLFFAQGAIEYLDLIHAAAETVIVIGAPTAKI